MSPAECTSSVTSSVDLSSNQGSGEKDGPHKSTQAVLLGVLINEFAAGVLGFVSAHIPWPDSLQCVCELLSAAAVATVGVNLILIFHKVM